MIYNREINGHKIKLVCESWNNRNSWGHEVTIYKNNNEIIGRAKIRYYNRTWECYRYRTTILKAIVDAIARITTEAKKTYKELHNYQVLTKKRAAEFAEYLTKDPEYNMYNELYRMF